MVKWLCILSLFLNYSLLAQSTFYGNKLDSITAVMKNAKSKKDSLASLEYLVGLQKHYNKYDDLKKTIEVFEKTIEESSSKKSFGILFKYKALLAYSDLDSINALKYNGVALNHFKNHVKELGFAYYDRANFYNKFRGFPYAGDSARFYYRKILTLDVDNNMMCRAEYGLARILMNELKYDQAYLHLQNGLRLSEGLPIKRKTDILRKLGELYFYLGDYENALKKYNEALPEIPINNSTIKTRAGLHTLIADVYYSKNNYKKALIYFKESLKLYESTKFSPTIAYIKNRLGEVYLSLNQINNAESSYYQAKDLIFNKNLFSYLKGDNFYLESRIHYAKDDFEAAEKAIVKSLSFLKKNSDYRKELLIREMECKIYKALGELAKENDCLRELVIIKDTVQSKDLIREMYLLEINSRKNKDQASQSTEKVSPRVKWHYYALPILVIGVLLVLFKKRFYIKSEETQINKILNEGNLLYYDKMRVYVDYKSIASENETSNQKKAIEINTDDIVEITTIKENSTRKKVKANYARVVDKENNSYYKRESLKTILSKLPDYFVRVNGQYIVNVKSKLTVNEIENSIAVNKKHLPITPTYAEHFFAIYSKYNSN